MGGGDGYQEQEAPILAPPSSRPAGKPEMVAVASPMLLQGEGGVLHRLLLYERGFARQCCEVSVHIS